MRPPPSSPDLEPFVASLPASYRARFDDQAVGAHLRLVASRGAAAVRVGVFEVGQPRVAALCVVTDDRPGLLAMLSAALLRHGLDVEEAEAYVRHVDGAPAQALDVFWVRRLEADATGPVPTAADAERVEATLTEWLAAAAARGGGRRSSRPAPGRGNGAQPLAVHLPRAPRLPALHGSASKALVRFVEGEGGQLCTLEVETNDRSGLLLAISEALFRQGAQIVRSEVKTRGRDVLDRFAITELDGSAIGAERRLKIQVAVLSAIDPAQWTTAQAAD